MSYNVLVNQIEVPRDAALVQDIVLPVNIPGMKACYDRIAAVDYTTALTLLTMGFKYGASEYLLESFITPGIGVVVCTNSRVFVDSDYAPFIRVTGGVAGDRIALFVYGYLAHKDQA